MLSLPAPMPCPAIASYLYARCSRCPVKRTFRLHDAAELTPEDTRAFLRERGWGSHPMLCPRCRQAAARSPLEEQHHQELLLAWLDDMRWH